MVGYKSGKLVVSGKRTEEFVQMTLEPRITGVVRLGYDEVNHPEWFELHALWWKWQRRCLRTTDFRLCDCRWRHGTPVAESGIADSKKITDSKILKLDKVIRETKGVVIKTVFARMEKYNRLYKKFGDNLNKLLTWYHGKALNEALKVRKAPWASSTNSPSKSSSTPTSKRAPRFQPHLPHQSWVRPRCRRRLHHRPSHLHPEMKALSEQTELELSKGASKQVLEQAKQIFENEGVEGLEQCAKMHFKPQYEAQGLQPPKNQSC